MALTIGDTAPDFDVVALDDALESLAQLEPRLAQVIELHYFGGLTYDQIAEAAGASAATVHRDIRLARAWLLNEIGSGSIGRHTGRPSSDAPEESA